VENWTGSILNTRFFAQMSAVRGTLGLFSKSTQPSLVFKRSIARLVAGKNDKLGSFDPRDSPLPPANPFNLPKTVNNAAEFALTTLDGIANWTRTSSIWY
jgi:hypothetical protein